MKKSVIMGFMAIVFCVSLCAQNINGGGGNYQQPPQDPSKGELGNGNKIWINAVAWTSWIDGTVSAKTKVFVRKNTQSGPILNTAVVHVNDRRIAYMPAANAFFGDIGPMKPGKRVYIRVSCGGFPTIRGHIAKSPFVQITAPSPGSVFYISGSSQARRAGKGGAMGALLNFLQSTLNVGSSATVVNWRFSDNSPHPVIFEILRGKSKIARMNGTGLSFAFNEAGLGVPLSPGETLIAVVRTTDPQPFSFPQAALGSKGNFFSSARLSMRVVRNNQR